MIYTAEHNGLVLHGICFNTGQSHRMIPWLVGSWSSNGKGGFIDWACYIGTSPSALKPEASMLDVAQWGAKVSEELAMTELSYYARHYGVEYRP